jgi:hypothetical protein
MAHDVIILSEKERKQADIEQFRYLFEEWFYELLDQS